MVTQVVTCRAHWYDGYRVLGGPFPASTAKITTVVSTTPGRRCDYCSAYAMFILDGPG